MTDIRVVFGIVAGCRALKYRLKNEVTTTSYSLSVKGDEIVSAYVASRNCCIVTASLIPVRLEKITRDHIIRPLDIQVDGRNHTLGADVTVLIRERIGAIII